MLLSVSRAVQPDISGARFVPVDNYFLLKVVGSRAYLFLLFAWLFVRNRDRPDLYAFIDFEE